MRPPHEVLGVPRGASPEEIRRAYRALARRHHPDVSGTPESAAIFAEIARAYEILTEQPDRPDPEPIRPDPGEHEPGGVYDAFFSRRSAAPRRPQTRFRRRPGTDDLEIEYPLSAHEAARGVSAPVPVPDGGTITVRVPPGVRDREEIRLPRRGVRRAGDRRGDLVVVLRVVRASGDDLLEREHPAPPG